jgi:hypothetical protein
MKHHTLQYVHVADILLVDIVNLNLTLIRVAGGVYDFRNFEQV